MSYTKKDFALGLTQQLRSHYDVVKMARWAFREFLDHTKELETGLEEEIMKVVSMEEGPQFEMTAQEIQELADELEKSQ